MSTKTDGFREELQRLLLNAQDMGFAAVEITAGALHRRVGGYPGTDHRMPICCNAMRQTMRATDAVVSEPEKGAGASLTVRYILPR